MRRRRFPVPMRRPTKRSSGILIPIIFLALFLFMMNRDSIQMDKDWKPIPRGNPYAMERGKYKKGPEGTRLRLEHSVQQAKANLREIENQHRGVTEKITRLERELREFQTAYKSTKGGSPWPVPVGGQDYNEEDLIAAVQARLAALKDLETKKENGAAKLASAQNAAHTLEAKLDQLTEVIEQEKSDRNKKELEDLMREADSWMAEKEKETPPPVADNDPVRTLDEILRDKKQRGEGSSRQALNYLKIGN